MPDYEVRLTVHADDAVDAHQILDEVILPPSVDILSTSLLGDDADHDEAIMKSTFLYTILHRTEDEIDVFEDATDLVSSHRALAQGVLISSAGVAREDVESELLEMGDEGDFFDTEL